MWAHAQCFIGIPVCSTSIRHCQRRQLPFLIEARLSLEGFDPPSTQKCPSTAACAATAVYLCSILSLRLSLLTVAIFLVSLYTQWSIPGHRTNTPSPFSLSLPPPSLPLVCLSFSVSLQFTDKSGNKLFPLMLKCPRNEMSKK